MPTTVRDMMKTAKKFGWVHDHTTGDHHIFYHPTIPGPLNISGNLWDTLKPGTERSIRKTMENRR